jgi:hypothetical protein
VSRKRHSSETTSHGTQQHTSWPYEAVPAVKFRLPFHPLHFTRYLLPFYPLESTDPLSKWRASIRRDGSSSDGAAWRRKPAGAMLVFPLARNVSAQVQAIRARSRPICFKVGEKTCNPCLSAGGAGTGPWLRTVRRQFIARE